MSVELEETLNTETLNIMSLDLESLELLGEFGATETERGDIVFKIHRNDGTSGYLLLAGKGADSVILPENPFTNDNQ